MNSIANIGNALIIIDVIFFLTVVTGYWYRHSTRNRTVNATQFATALKVYNQNKEKFQKLIGRQKPKEQFMGGGYVPEWEDSAKPLARNDEETQAGQNNLEMRGKK